MCLHVSVCIRMHEHGNFMPSLVCGGQRAISLLLEAECYCHVPHAILPLELAFKLLGTLSSCLIGGMLLM